MKSKKRGNLQDVVQDKVSGSNEVRSKSWEMFSLVGQNVTNLWTCLSRRT